jgi:hypothetical protein
MAKRPTERGEDLDPLQLVEDFGEDKVPEKKEEPPFRVFEGSRIAVSRATGKLHKLKVDAALAANEIIYGVWNEAFSYYRADHGSIVTTPKGVFNRGDSMENVVYSNLNTILASTYSKNPDISCASTDAQDEPFIQSLQSLLNRLVKGRVTPALNLKPKMKRAALHAELTNYGVLKLDFNQKDQSSDFAIASMEKLTADLAEAKSQQQLQAVYGKLQAMEAQVELREPSGSSLTVVLPHNHLVDPTCEQQDGLDASWQAERAFLPTEFLRERFTKPSPDGRVLVFKPTHKASIAESGEKDDTFGLILEAIDHEDRNRPEDFTDPERLSYIYQYMTEVWFFWDKTTRRVFLYQRDDWTWPLWVWDDPLHLSRFFPYFLVSFTALISGAVGAGEVSYYLDQQDEINEINRQLSRIRSTVFNYFIYNSELVNKQEAEKLIKAIRGEGKTRQHAVGVKADANQKLDEIIKAIVPPSLEYKELFAKEPAYAAIDRIGSTSDALRGAQFKTNTTEDAVQSYMSAARIRIGTKIDTLEDVIADICHSLAELCVQFMSKDEVVGLIGGALAEGWREMDVPAFNSTISVEIVAGSIEKPTSLFKKQEAIQVAQAVGQFSRGAPGSTLKVILRTLEKAFTEVVIKKEDWDSIEQEIAANLQKGVSTPGGEGGEAEGADPQSLPPEGKARVVQALRSGGQNAAKTELQRQMQNRTGGAKGQ